MPQCGDAPPGRRPGADRRGGEKKTGPRLRGAEEVVHRERRGPARSSYLVEVHVTLRERNRDPALVQGKLDLFGHAEVRAPVVVRLAPRAHDEVDARVAQLGHGHGYYYGECAAERGCGGYSAAR